MECLGATFSGPSAGGGCADCNGSGSDADIASGFDTDGGCDTVGRATSLCGRVA